MSALDFAPGPVGRPVVDEEHLERLPVERGGRPAHELADRAALVEEGHHDGKLGIHGSTLQLPVRWMPPSKTGSPRSVTTVDTEPAGWHVGRSRSSRRWRPRT